MRARMNGVNDLEKFPGSKHARQFSMESHIRTDIAKRTKGKEVVSLKLLNKFSRS